MAISHGKNSFLKNAGFIDEFLDINKLPVMPSSVYDEQYTIKPDVEGRPDILAYKLYGSTNLWWVFALRNPDTLIDPIRDFKAGTVITLPSDDSVKRVTGG
tara:strand:+ start:158 stop:460 length:303 start_codon:yes stop_codon:yes gene_type:complete